MAKPTVCSHATDVVVEMDKLLLEEELLKKVNKTGVEGAEPLLSQKLAEALLTHDFVTLEERDISPDVDIMMAVPRTFFSIDRS